MKKYHIIIASLLIIVGNIANAQSSNSLVGQYLMSVQVKGKAKEADPMKTAIAITPNNELQALQADGEEPEAIAQLQFEKDKVHMQFIPFLGDMSGDYNINYQTHGAFVLDGEQREIRLLPFEPDEIGNQEMGIVGKWHLTENNKDISIEFQLPNVVRVIEKKDNLTLDEYFFWGAYPNGEDVFVTAVPFFNPFSGTLKQIQVKDNVLHFDYKGEHYAMPKAISN